MLFLLSLTIYYSLISYSFDFPNATTYAITGQWSGKFDAIIIA